MGGLETRRIFLGLGLAVSAYLLILAWTSQPDQIGSQRLTSISGSPAIEPIETGQNMEISSDRITPLPVTSMKFVYFKNIGCSYTI